MLVGSTNLSEGPLSAKSSSVVQLAAGAPVNARTSVGITPLGFAVSTNNHYGVVRALVLCIG